MTLHFDLALDCDGEEIDGTLTVEARAHKDPSDDAPSAWSGTIDYRGFMPRRTEDLAKVVDGVKWAKENEDRIWKEYWKQIGKG